MARRTVELLKVLLRMTSERHRVAAKVIATVDELERIAADDHADVPALNGWRRELFGEKAIALKHGKLALAIEKGKVAAVERESGLRHPISMTGSRPMRRASERRRVKTRSRPMPQSGREGAERGVPRSTASRVCGSTPGIAADTT